MGSLASTVRDVGLQQLAFAPPPCAYTLGQCDTVMTADGDRVALRLFVQEQNTLQNWRARRDYVDTRLLIIFSHGNSDDIQTSAPYCEWLSRTFDANVVSYDYIGFGQSTKGRTTEVNMCQAIEAVYDLAVNRMGVPPQQVVLFGKSIGTGPTVYLASGKRPTSGVILVSPLASGVRCVCDSESVPRAILECIDGVFMPSVQRMAQVKVPTCVVHGTDDEVIGIDNAQALVARCGALAVYPPLYVPAGHNDIETRHGPLFVAHIRRFLGYTANIAALPYTRDVDD